MPCLSGSAHVKAVRKHVDEINPWCCCSSSPPPPLHDDRRLFAYFDSIVCKYSFFSFSVCLETIKRKMQFFLLQTKKKVKNFFFSLLAKNFPPTINIFCVPCLLSKKRRTIKYFMTTKKILFDVFSKTYFLCKETKERRWEREKKGNCIFYFTQKKLLFVWLTSLNLFKHFDVIKYPVTDSFFVFVPF